MNIDLLTTIILPILAIAIPVFATVYTVNNRIKNENRENHKPYIVLKKIETLKDLDIDRYYLTMIGRNYREKNGINVEKINTYLPVNLVIRNIGYGVATNLKFYDLLTGERISGTQASNKQKNQKLFTTFDIASMEVENLQVKIISLVEEIDGIINPDHNRILCVYKDLNDNLYNFIISINIKDGNHYDFFAYQPSSVSYKKWVKESKKQYQKIIKQYKQI